MVQVEQKIWVAEKIFEHEYQYYYGDKKNELVSFTYYNFKKDRESTQIKVTYEYALALARSRSRDGRYKNFEYFIGL